MTKMLFILFNNHHNQLQHSPSTVAQLSIINWIYFSVYRTHWCGERQSLETQSVALWWKVTKDLSASLHHLYSQLFKLTKVFPHFSKSYNKWTAVNCANSALKVLFVVVDVVVWSGLVIMRHDIYWHQCPCLYILAKCPCQAWGWTMNGRMWR